MNINKGIKKILSGSRDVNSMQIAALIRFSLVWVIYIALAQSDTPLEWIGRYELFLFVANLFAFSLLYGGKNAVLNYDLQDDDNKLMALLAGAFLVFSASGFLLAMLFLGVSSFSNLLPELQGISDYRYYHAAFIFLLVSSSVLDFFLLLKKQFKWIVRQALFFNGLMGAVVITAIIFYKNLELAFLLMTLVMFLQTLFVALICRKGFRHLRLFDASSFLKKGFLPLTLFALLGGLANYIDGFLVLFLSGSEEMFAIFRYGARELPVSVLLTGGVVSAMVPLVVSDRVGASKKIKKELATLYHQLFPLTIGLVLLSPFLYPLVFTQDFAASAGIFNIYLLLLFSRLLMPQVYLYAFKRNKILLIAAGLEIVVNLSLSLWWYSLYGIYGIAWASVIAYMLSKCVMLYYLAVKEKIKMRDLVLVRPYTTYGIVLVLAYLVSLLYTTTL